MLEIKSPWNLEIIDQIDCHTEKDIESFLDAAKKVSLKKGLDFSPKERITI